MKVAVNGYFQKQKDLFDDIEKKFKSGEVPSTIVEALDDYKNDNQICLTSVAFLSKSLQRKIITDIISPLKKTDPRQYFYLAKSLHLTIQNIRTVNKPPLFTDEDIEKTKEVFAKIIPKHSIIKFKLEGLFELPTSLGLRAYSSEDLKGLCVDLREGLKKAGVPDNKIYASEDIIFGNVSVSRYTLAPNKEFFEIVKKLKNVEIGTFNVQSVSLITTNSVCYPNKTKIIKTYNLQ